MARRRRTAVATTARIVRVNSPAPIVRISAPRPAKVRRRSRRRHHGGGRIGGGLISNESVQLAIGGMLYGYAVKAGIVAKLPALPLLGRTGTAALLLDYFGRHGGGQLCTKAAHAAASIAGYQLGSEGTITGDANDFVQGGDFAAGDGYEPE